MFVDRRLTFRGQRRSQDHDGLVASVASLPWLLDTVILEMRVVRCLPASACLRAHLSNLNSTALYHNRDRTIDLTRSICGITT